MRFNFARSQIRIEPIMSNRRKSLSFDRTLLIIPLMVIACLALPFLEKVCGGLASPWKKLPASPSRPVQLLGTGKSDGMAVGTIEGDDGVVRIQGDVYIQAADGQVYNYEDGVIWHRRYTAILPSSSLCALIGLAVGSASGISRLLNIYFTVL